MTTSRLKLEVTNNLQPINKNYECKKGLHLTLKIWRQKNNN
jgi:hypothetical protein